MAFTEKDAQLFRAAQKIRDNINELEIVYASLMNQLPQPKRTKKKGRVGIVCPVPLRKSDAKKRNC